MSGSTTKKGETPSPGSEVKPCPHCCGSGACGSCGGTGTVYRPGPLDPWDPFPIDPECLTCRGTGDCEYCRGTGQPICAGRLPAKHPCSIEEMEDLFHSLIE